jgi:hypothetical protein
MLDHLQLFILPTVITVIGFSPFKIKWLGQYSYLLEGEKIESSKEGQREERAMKKEWIEDQIRTRITAPSDREKAKEEDE